MPTRMLLVTLVLSVWLMPSFKAAAQTACENRCKSDGACLKRCADAQKRSAQPKPSQTAPKAPASSADSSSGSGWRGRVFSTDGGGGGGY